MIRIDRRSIATQIISDAKERLTGTIRVTGEVRAAWTTIASLPPEVDPAVIDGMDFCGITWTSCDTCARFVSAVVEMGEEGYEVRVCRDCLISALELLPDPVEVMPCSGT
jgi:hypothetical protein